MGNYRPVLDEGLKYGMAVDITERKEAEEALHASERRTRLILDTAYETAISMAVLEEERAERIRLATLLHDVGKVGVPDRILKSAAP